jgi:hypothetical protein
MKNFARLTLFFSSCFVILFAGAGMFKLLSIWVEMARAVPAGPGDDAAEFAWKALPVALYLSMLLSLSYSARRNMPVSMSIICLVFLCFAFTFGLSRGIYNTEILNPVLDQGSSINAGPGLVFSERENTIVLLKDSGETQGARVVSFPGRPLMYQELPLGPNNAPLGLPPLPLGGGAPWIVQSVSIDFNLCAAELKNRLELDLLSFVAYAFSLILLLGSLRFILELSRWPLANIFLGALVFRGILALEVFLNSHEVNSLIGSFLTGIVPAPMVTPLAFGVLGILIILYTALAGVARRASASGREDD